MNQQPLVSSAPQKKNTVPKIFWVITGLFVLLVVAGVFLFATKQLVFAIGATNQDAVTVVSRVCTKDTIALYNKSNTAATYQLRTDGLKSAFDAVTSTNGYANDPNCVYIRYAYYINLKDVANAQKEVDTLTSLATKNLYATTELVFVQPIQSMQADINILKLPAGQAPAGDVGGGGRG